MKKKAKKSKDTHEGYDKVIVKDVFTIYFKVDNNDSDIKIQVDYHKKGKELVDTWCKENNKTEEEYFNHLFQDAIKNALKENETKKRTDKKLSD